MIKTTRDFNVVLVLSSIFVFNEYSCYKLVKENSDSMKGANRSSRILRSVSESFFRNSNFTRKAFTFGIFNFCSPRIPCPKNEYCTDFGFCDCNEYFEYDDMEAQCIQCPGLGFKCANNECCGSNLLQCVNNYCQCNDIYREYAMCSTEPALLITASQIALSAALIMGIVAMVLVIYRLCSKPHYVSARHRAAIQRPNDMTSASRTSFLRASLTSIQVRVLSRLRDRPPAYENHRQQQINTISSTLQSMERRRSTGSLSSTVNPDSLPPPYEVHRHREIDLPLPPPYSEVVTNPNGFSNPSYSETESVGAINRLDDDDTDPKILTRTIEAASTSNGDSNNNLRKE